MMEAQQSLETYPNKFVWEEIARRWKQSNLQIQHIC